MLNESSKKNINIKGCIWLSFVKKYEQEVQRRNNEYRDKTVCSKILKLSAQEKKGWNKKLVKGK